MTAHNPDFATFLVYNHVTSDAQVVKIVRRRKHSLFLVEDTFNVMRSSPFRGCDVCCVFLAAGLDLLSIDPAGVLAISLWIVLGPAITL